MDSLLDSSTEELSTEERLILSSRKRQEPQGEEHDNSTNKGEPQVSNQLDSSSSGSECSSICGDREVEREPGLIYGKSKLNNMSLDSNSHSAYNTLIIHHNNSSLLADTWIPASHEFTSVGMGANRNSNPRSSTSPTRDNPGALSEIPRDCLDQLTVLKHLAKEVQQDPVSGPTGQSLLRSSSFSKSQPDLTQSSLLSTSSECHDLVPKAKKKKHPHSSGASGSSKQSVQISGKNTPPCHASSGPSVQILEILMRENANLKAELVNAHRKISIIQKLEAELTRLQASHAALFESTERRESLERTARSKLSTEVKRLTAVNRELLSSSNSLQNLSPYAASSDIELLKKELVKKDLTIAQLVSQNKELIATKERQEIELAAQRATLAEQRNHIDILDTALTNAQSNVLRLEEEARKKQEYVDKVSQLQRALSSLQLSSEKREQSEKKLRNQLETEVTDLKLQLASSNASSNNHSQITHSSTPSLLNSNSNGRQYQQQPGPQPPPYPGIQHSSHCSNNQLNIQVQTQQEIQNLQDKLKASEEKILTLDAQVAKWEQFFASAGSEKPNLASNSVSTPNTPNSWSSRGGTPHFFGSNSSSGVPDDLMQTQSRATDLEWKIKDLESRLSERDAMIRVLHLQNVPSSTSGYSGLTNQNANNSSGASPLFSSFNSSSSSSVAAMALPSYRESPTYSSANGKNHQVSVSLASISQNPINMMDPVLMYSKMGKCDSEPPSYANLPMKMRLGGSGSSLAKNSNESLQSGNGNCSGPMGTSGHGSLSTSSNKSGNQGAGKSIEEQLKELDNQLLTKGGPSGLKMQSGLCCIPGFSHPGPPARKGKVSQSLLESLNQQVSNVSSQESSGSNNSSNVGNNINGNASQKKPFLPPLPLPKLPNSLSHFQHPMQIQYPSHSQSVGNQQTIRTSSGPPFISPSGSSNSSSLNPPVSHGTTLSLSNSVDSILSDGNKNPNCNVNVFTPVTSLPKGLPPKSPVEVSATTANKCRSLERNKPTTELGAGKYTAVNYDATRCKSLDRREMKSHGKAEEKQEKKLLKSSVSSKAAFFGQLLTRRSPSPSRNKEKEKPSPEQSSSQTHITQPKVVRFPFATIGKTSDSEHDLDAAFLDKQGRSSQRNRVSKWTMSSSNLEAVQEQEPTGSPWIQRRSAEVLESGLAPPLHDQITTGSNGGSRNETSGPAPAAADSKKWGKIVKTPFGLRYTFGSPKLSESVSASKLKGADGNQIKDRLF
ncbi:unnamed protein product [Allacma fusca]|uniref:Angiomotin C-terminal domain-containing protein n=1 Tax=Allacma fusca TaxID=39272 RepID=A0A8J2JKE0_9HEXA|nr:unnamed protein product [Allacma fusca]